MRPKLEIGLQHGGTSVSAAECVCLACGDSRQHGSQLIREAEQQRVGDQMDEHREADSIVPEHLSI